MKKIDLILHIVGLIFLILSTIQNYHNDKYTPYLVATIWCLTSTLKTFRDV